MSEPEFKQPHTSRLADDFTQAVHTISHDSAEALPIKTLDGNTQDTLDAILCELRITTMLLKGILQ